MERIDKIKLAIDRGYTYDPITGGIYNKDGKELKAKSSQGYIIIGLKVNSICYTLKAHQLAYYIIHNRLCEEIDHINGIRTDNRICNLREVSKQQNQHNRIKAKGYYYHKRDKKFRASIALNGKNIFIGNYNTELEAREAYLEAKKKYHNV